jgi:hypothetical protein
MTVLLTQDDIDQYSIFKKEGNVVTALETAVTPDAEEKKGMLTFPNLDEDGVLPDSLFRLVKSSKSS